MKQRIYLSLAVIVLASLIGGCRCPSPRDGSDAPAPPDIPQLVAVLQAADLEARAMDAGSLVLSRDGLNVLIFAEDEGSSLQAVLACTRYGVGDPRLVARWNATRRFGRAYLDEDSRPTLASDIALEPAISEAAVAAWGRLVMDMAWVFFDEVWPLPAAPVDPVNE